LGFWAPAFASLCVTLVLLNIFWDLIEQDLCLQVLSPAFWPSSPVL